jgi:membrane associated rhomboid family serine protease
VLQDGQQSLLVVPVEFVEKAKYELWQYEAENRQPSHRPKRITPVYQDPIWGVTGYIATISLVAVMAGYALFSGDWFTAGRVDGALIRAGEWWRTITALTLHSGLPHFVGNVGFGALFGMMAGRVLGPGVTWLAVVLSSSVANLVNTLLLDSAHKSIGASTAVFAALGLVAGFAWRAKLDTGAHLMGFVFGFISGTALTLVYRYLPDQRVQKVSGAAAICIVIIAWATALGVWA